MKDTKSMSWANLDLKAAKEAAARARVRMVVFMGLGCKGVFGCVAVVDDSKVGDGGSGRKSLLPKRRIGQTKRPIRR